MGTEYRVAKIQLSRVEMNFLESLWGKKKGAVEKYLTAMNYQGILALAKLTRDDKSLPVEFRIAAQEVVLEHLYGELDAEYAAYKDMAEPTVAPKTEEVASEEKPLPTEDSSKPAGGESE